MTVQIVLLALVAATSARPALAEVKPDPPAPATAVKGKVVDSEGKPVPGATITVSMRDGPHRSFTAAVRSGKDGTFSIGLRPGEFDFVAVVQGNQAARTKPFVLRAGQTKDVGVLMLAPISPPPPPDIRKPK
jgi:hypothetical protein